MSLGIREMQSDLHRLAAGQVSTFPAGHASRCVQMQAFQLKSPRWQGKSKLTTLEIGALQSWGDLRLAVTLNTCKAPSIKKKIKKKNKIYILTTRSV
jgi:hypothetical protein